MIRTEVLQNGFKTELNARHDDLKAARVELERLFAARVDDAAIEKPEHSQMKESMVKGLRMAEAAFNSYGGSVRSIKSVLDALKNIYGINFEIGLTKHFLGQ